MPIQVVAFGRASADHDIFNKPFKVNLTIEKVDTPEGYRRWYDGVDLPEKIDAWRVAFCRKVSRIWMGLNWCGSLTRKHSQE